MSEIPIDTKCLILRWSPVGDYLAIVQEKNVLKWSLLGGTTMFNMPRGVKCMDLVDWSNTGILAVACRKGKILLITNDNNIHLLDKHLNPISSLKWNSKNELATCAVDNTVTLSDDQGQTTSSVLLKTTINNLKWDNNSNQAVLAAVGNNQSIVLFLNGVLTSRVELVTSAKYGSIMDYFFMTDQILVAMEKAQILILSIHGDSMGKLQSVHKIYSEYLSSIDISIKPGKMVTIGDDCVKLQDLDFKSSEQLFPLHDSKRQNAEVEFEPFGQMLTAKFGSELSVIQLSETQLFKYWRSRLVCSIGSSINFIEFDSGEFQSFDCNFEATTVYVGPKYVSAVGGMQVWHQEVDSGFSPSAGNSRYISQFNENLKTKDSLPCISNYPFVVKFVYTNSDFVLVTAASTESFLHQISDDPKSEKDLLEFPGNGVHVVDAHFTDTHLIYQTAFEIIYWDCQEMVECIKYQHSVTQF